MPTVRPAAPEDAPRLLEIYAWYVENTAITFDLKAPDLSTFASRMASTLKHYPYLVIEEDGVIRGYAYAGPFVGREAYRFSCEVTIYLDRDFRRRGFGRALYAVLEEKLRAMGIRNLYACIGDPPKEDRYLSHDSEAFHRHLGYTKVGTFHACGYKFGRWYNMIWMERLLSTDSGDAPAFLSPLCNA